MLDELVKAIRSRQALLFVGAGVSVNLGLPSWSGLVAHIATELGYDADVFSGPDANYLTLAEYYKIQKGAIGPLRSWMDVNWNTTDDKILEISSASAYIGARIPNHIHDEL